VAYADRDTRNHERLKRGDCPEVLKVDVSYREPIYAVELIRLDADSSISAYSTTDVIAEKLRALLQQVSRGYPRRRQDVYDLAFLARRIPPDDAEKEEILRALKEKARARDIEPRADSLSDPEIRKRAEQDWDTLDLELTDLPPFEQEYRVVEDLYLSLPWDSSSA
jgi:predicted nucleotidyltransferase component of viral defense system